MKVTKIYYICDKCGKKFNEEDRYPMTIYIPKKNMDDGNFEYGKRAEAADLCSDCGIIWFQAHAEVDYNFFRGEDDDEYRDS